MMSKRNQECLQEIIDLMETAEPLDTDGMKAVALCYLADAVYDVAYQIKCLGLGNASTQMGAMEVLAKAIATGRLEG